MYKPTVISPSALAATEACPRFRPDGKENDAAAEGTLLHEMLEQMVQQPASQWESWINAQTISAEHRGFLQVAASELNQLVEDGLPVYPNKRLRYRAGLPRKTKLPPGLYPELEIETSPGRHGYIDLLIVNYDNQAICIDYKSVRSAHDYTLQLGAYALYLHRLVPAFEYFECRIIAPRLYGDPEVHRWTVDDLMEVGERIDNITLKADDSANNPLVVGCPGDQCQYCHWNGRCPYQTEAVLASRPTDTPSPAIPSARMMMHPATPEDRGKRRSCIKFIEAFIKAVKDDDAQWVADQGGMQIDPACVPGWKLSWRNGRATLDESRESEAREALMASLDFTIEEIMECSKLSTTALVETISRKYGYTESAAKKELQKTLDPYMRPAGKVLYWTQTAEPIMDVPLIGG